MMFENREKLNNVAQKAMEEFAIKGKPVFHQTSENATYFIEIENKPAYTLRISRPEYHTLEEIQGEIQWLLQLEDLPAVRPFAIDGKYVVNICGYYCTMYKYIEGISDINIEGNENLFVEIGRLAGLLHKNIIERPLKIKRPIWSIDNLIGKNALWGDWRKCQKLNLNEKEILESACKLIKQKISTYNTKKYGLIHIDLRLTNIIVDKSISVIDFDDCGYGFFMQDLAASVSFLENSESLPLLIENWYRGYEEILPLNNEDKAMAQSFILARQLQLLGWITSHSKSDYVQGLDSDFYKKCVENGLRYINEK